MTVGEDLWSSAGTEPACGYAKTWVSSLLPDSSSSVHLCSWCFVYAVQPPSFTPSHGVQLLITPRHLHFSIQNLNYTSETFLGVFFFSLIHSSIPSHRPLLFCSMGRPHPKITAHWSCTCEDVKCQAAGQYTTAVVVVDSTQTYCHITCSHTDLTNVYKWNSNTRPRSHTLNLINWTLSDTVNRNTLNDTTYFPHLDSVTRMMM